jgi:hypothetical protein
MGVPTPSNALQTRADSHREMGSRVLETLRTPQKCKEMQGKEESSRLPGRFSDSPRAAAHTRPKPPEDSPGRQGFSRRGTQAHGECGDIARTAPHAVLWRLLAHAAALVLGVHVATWLPARPHPVSQPWAPPPLGTAPMAGRAVPRHRRLPSRADAPPLAGCTHPAARGNNRVSVTILIITPAAAEWALRSAGTFIIRTADSRESLISQIA